MQQEYQHLGVFSDWVNMANTLHPEKPFLLPGNEIRSRIQETLNFSFQDEDPRDLLVERSWEHNGLIGEEISWSVGFGPRTHAWVFKPSDSQGALPCILALHDHGGYKYHGRKKIADSIDETSDIVQTHREEVYGGQAWVNALAKEGFLVMAHDAFLFGSRRFPLESMPDSTIQISKTFKDWYFQADWPCQEIVRYNAAANLHETIIEKYCSLLGTTLAGVVAYEDRVAANYLASREDGIPGRMACLGLSGGGLRTALLLATCDSISTAGIMGMMSTYENLLDHNVASHTSMFFPGYWPRYGDWPDIVASRAPLPLLVQNNIDDPLFTEEGMRAADRHIKAYYQNAGKPNNYTCEFYPGLHKFDLEMQAAAFSWLTQNL